MRYLSFIILSTFVSTTAYAQDSNPSHMLQLPPGTQQQQVVAPQPPALPAITNNAQLDGYIRSLQHSWAKIKYQTPEAQQEDEMGKLAEQAKALVASYPAYAEPRIWAAIILSTQAGFNGGIGAIGLTKDAKALLEEAEKINSNAMDGSIYTSLGSLYYKVPGWPVGFGDNDKARAYLEQALAMNPNGIDPNYFYGDFLIEQGDYAQAVQVLQHALQAAPRPGREDADAGRRQEIQQAIATAQSKLKG